MSTVALPLRTDLPHYDFTTELDGKSYTFVMKWNEREEAWYMDLYDSTNTLVIASRKIVIGWPLTNRYQDETLPPGTLIAVDTSNANQDPGLEDLGERVEIWYIEA